MVAGDRNLRKQHFRLLRDFSKQADEMGKRIMGGEVGNYDEALRIIMEYV